MSLSNDLVLSKAIEITKEYARGGGGISPETVLQNVYNMVAHLGNGTPLAESERRVAQQHYPHQQNQAR